MEIEWACFFSIYLYHLNHPRNHKGDRGMIVFFYLYHTYHSLENGNHEICMGHPPFTKANF